MSRLPHDPENFIRTNTALEAPAMVPEFKLWLATEYVPIWQATEAWLEAQNVDPPYWAFCWPGGQAIARYLLDNPEQVRGKRVIDFAAGSGVSSMAAARAGAASVIANDIDALSLVAARLNGQANGLTFEVSAEDWLAGPDGADVINTFADKPANWKPLVYCWRGGLRSGSMVTWLRLVGWDAQQLANGYKSYRGHVIELIDRLTAKRLQLQPGNSVRAAMLPNQQQQAVAA